MVIPMLVIEDLECSCLTEFIKEVEKKDKMQDFAKHLIFSTTSLINSIIHI